jgi:alkanesulfonate monooxygenase SsuD/methylene tetrahydromethanopterin reductase-like flavin-dependent oxidoreductase (luciferase family)
VKLGLVPYDPHASFRDIRALALAAEAAGFDSFWLPDHLLSEGEDQGFWDVFTVLSAIAALTQRITIGSPVACASFHNPGPVAKIADTLDEVSQGRFVLGLGSGWYQPEHAAFGYPFDHLTERFEEALQIIVPLLRDGQADFSGAFVQARNARLIPRGPTPGGPPILIGARRPRMLRLVARYADAWNTNGRLTPESVAERYADLLAACAEVGRDPATLALTVGTEARIVTPGETFASDEAIVGSAEEVTQRLRGFAGVGVTHLMLLIPGVNPEQVARFAPVASALADA